MQKRFEMNVYDKKNNDLSLEEKIINVGLIVSVWADFQANLRKLALKKSDKINLNLDNMIDILFFQQKLHFNEEARILNKKEISKIFHNYEGKNFLNKNIIRKYTSSFEKIDQFLENFFQIKIRDILISEKHQLFISNLERIDLEIIKRFEKTRNILAHENIWNNAISQNDFEYCCEAFQKICEKLQIKIV